MESSLEYRVFISVPGTLLLQQPHLLHGEGQPSVHGAEHEAVVLPQQGTAVAHHEATQLPGGESWWRHVSSSPGGVDVGAGHVDRQQLVGAGEGGALPAGDQGTAASQLQI